MIYRLSFTFGLLHLLAILYSAPTLGETATESDAEGTASCGAADWPSERAACQPITLGSVQVSGNLGQRIDRNLNSLLVGLKSPIPRGFEAYAVGKPLPPEATRQSGRVLGYRSDVGAR